MADKLNALRRMREKVLDSTRSGGEEAVSEVARPAIAEELAPEAVVILPSEDEPAARGVEAAGERKLSALGRLRKKVLVLTPVGCAEPLPEQVEDEKGADPVPDAAVVLPEAGEAEERGAEAAPETLLAADEMADNAGIEEARADHADEPAEEDAAEEPLQPPRVNREKIGWVSPAYTVSRPVQLDPHLVARNKCVAFLPDVAEMEPYRVLRTQILQRTRERGGNTIMITSALPGEGKTLTAINLALTFAKEFKQTVLLVDCDLRRQRIHDLLGIESAKGLNEYLLDDCPISDLMVWPGVEKLTLISGGRTISESSELLGSPRMKELVEDMKHRYPDRYVIFDVPAVLAGADALAFAPLVDHIVVTVKAGETPMSEVTRAVKMLPRDKVLGLVLNRQRRDAK